MPISRFAGLDDFSRTTLRRLATHWRDSPLRPALSGHEALRWHGLIEDWVHDRSLPLLVRRPREGRGREIQHPSGRVLVPTDDAPALYLLSLAMEHRRPTRQQLLHSLLSGRMPIAISLGAQERRLAQYRGTLLTMDAPNLAALGYTLCHITQIGLRRAPLRLRTEIELVAHSLLFLSPINMFVVPRSYAGLGSLPEFVDEMDQAGAFPAST